MKKITTIVPIYNAFSDVKKLLKSLALNYNFEIGDCLLINDCSDKKTTDFLKKYVLEHKQFKLLENEENLGFVKTCNRGMKLSKSDITVLLNSDTRIPPNFCEKIAECFESDMKIGVASPISSNSKSYYIPLRESYSLKKMNDLINKKHVPVYPMLPEAEGFCFCIRKEVIENQGYFDEIYQKGYHEELDYSYRALTNGWKIALIDSLYVYHKGQASFGKEETAKYKIINNYVFRSRWYGFRDKYKKKHNLVNPCIAIEKEVFGKQQKFKKSYSVREYKKYIEYLEDGYQTEFVEYKSYPQSDENKVKPIAFYLPQYYHFKENDEWHGKGFTEWTNVTKAMPQYAGHFQPHLPYDVGFYTLDNTDIMHRQAELAKNYGIHGFAFHYYWFSGRRLMEKPIYNYLNDKSIDFPFCLCWPCENWSKLWDGGNKEVLVESKLSRDDFEPFWNDILPFFQDKRYIRINNKPVFIIYKPSVFDKKVFDEFLTKIRQYAKKTEFKELYLIVAVTFEIFENGPFKIEDTGFDAFVEFPPHGILNVDTAKKIIITKEKYGYINNNFRGELVDVKKYVDMQYYEKTLFNNIYRTVFPMWDNSPRKAQTGCYVMEGMTPDVYEKWLEGVVQWTRKNRPQSEQFVFVNAWNEWGEGAHLEPDTKHGYAYLDKTRNVIDRN